MFCVHHRDLRQRKRRLTRVFGELGFAVEWVETYHPRDVDTWDHPPIAAVSIQASSCGLKHRQIIRRQIDEEIGLIVVFEDDVQLPKTFAPDLDRYLDEFAALGGELLMIGSGNAFHAPDVTPDRSVYLAPLPRTRATHAYALTLAGARVLWPFVEQLNRPIDLAMDRAVQDVGLTMCWVEPGVRQGTLDRWQMSTIPENRVPGDRKRVLKRLLRLRHVDPASD